MSKKLTGRQRYRVAGDLVVLQVEEENDSFSYYTDCVPSWRDATVGDVTTHKAPKLMVEDKDT